MRLYNDDLHNSLYSKIKFDVFYKILQLYTEIYDEEGITFTAAGNHKGQNNFRTVVFEILSFQGNPV